MQALKLLERAGFIPDGVVHVGANDGQERYEYLAAGLNPCIYVEPIDEVFSRLKSHIGGMTGHIAIQAVCDEESGRTVVFNIASNAGLSSSMLQLGDHALYHPSVTYTATQEIVTTTVDDLLEQNEFGGFPNLLVVDTQGAELRVLKGAVRSLARMDAVFVEVSETPLYLGGADLTEVSTFLTQYGFLMRWMDLDAHGHGDAFFCRPLQVPADFPDGGLNHALGSVARQSSRSMWSTENDPAGAVNGRKTGSYGFHTDKEHAPWWSVELSPPVDLREIRVFNRVDVARERARFLQIHVSSTGEDWTLVHAQNGRTFGGADGRPLRVFCDARGVRFVRLQLEGEDSLHLDEVEIYGDLVAEKTVR